jgi:hypothetical protein
MQTNIEERVRTILAAQFCVDAEEIDLSADLKERYAGRLARSGRNRDDRRGRVRVRNPG